MFVIKEKQIPVKNLRKGMKIVGIHDKPVVVKDISRFLNDCIIYYQVPYGILDEISLPSDRLVRVQELIPKVDKSKPVQEEYKPISIFVSKLPESIISVNSRIQSPLLLLVLFILVLLPVYFIIASLILLIPLGILGLVGLLIIVFSQDYFASTSRLRVIVIILYIASLFTTGPILLIYYGYVFVFSGYILQTSVINWRAHLLLTGMLSFVAFVIDVFISLILRKKYSSFAQKIIRLIDIGAVLIETSIEWLVEKMKGLFSDD